MARVIPRAMLVLAVVATGCAHGPPRFDPRARPTCLVLSVGGPAGVAHLGAVRAVQDAHVPISCVVGNSMGALVGSLYATAPASDPEPRFRQLAASYADATKTDSIKNGLGFGLVLSGLAALATDGLAAPALAFLGGTALGVQATARLEHDRLVRVLDRFYAGAQIEALPVRYATFFQEGTSGGVVMRTATSGNLAAAVGGSVANPLIFSSLVIGRGRPIDPGGDRVSATPVEDACRLFPHANLLVINATGQPAFFSADMKCPLREIRIDPGVVTPEDVFAFGPTFTRVVAAGHDATAAGLRL